MISSLYSIEKLDESNYDAWRIQMQSVLVHCDLWPYVSGGKAKPAAGDAELPAWETKDQKALATIMLSVKTSQLLHTKHCKESAEAWKKLEEVHRPTGPSRKVTVFRQLINLKMVEGASITSHLNSFFVLYEKLYEIDIKLPDELLSIILLSSLPKSYENFVVAIESRDELPKAHTLKAKLTEEGSRREGDVLTEHSNGEAAFFSKQQRQQKQHTSQHRGKCFKCQKRGHYAKDCKSSTDSKAAPPANPKKSSAAFAMLNSTGFAKLDKSMWVLDSGTTCHMCCNRDIFDSIHPHREMIQLAANNYIYSEGIGEVMVTTKTTQIHLKRVLFVPSLNTNFMSMSKATDSNFNVKFDNTSAVIQNDSGSIILRAKKEGNLYVYSTVSESLYNMNTDNTFFKWHERYGHLNARSLSTLMRKELVRGLDFKNVLDVIEC